MYTIDTELLPLECKPLTALKIYLNRLTLFLSVITLGASPIYILFVHHAYTDPKSPFSVTTVWLAGVAHLILASVVFYFARLHYLQEDSFRALALVKKMFDEVVERSDILMEWLHSIKSKLDELSTEEAAEEFEFLVGEAEIEAREIRALKHIVDQKLSQLRIQTDEMFQRVDELNHHINAIQTSLTELNSAATPLRERYAS